MRQQQEVSEHLCKGGLWQDSICRRFTLDEKNVLLQWSNLQPTRWTPLRTADALSPVLCPGYYHVTILGEVTQWWHPKLKNILFAVPATSASVEYCLISCIILFFSFFFMSANTFSFLNFLTFFLIKSLNQTKTFGLTHLLLNSQSKQIFIILHMRHQWVIVSWKLTVSGNTITQSEVWATFRKDQNVYDLVLLGLICFF